MNDVLHGFEVQIGGTPPYGIFEFEDGEIHIIGPHLPGSSKKSNMISSKETFEDDAKELAREWNLHKEVE